MTYLRLSNLLMVMLFSFFAAAQAPVDTKKADDKDSSHKNEISEILDSMGYPELQVVPRASERLAIEAKSEGASGIVTHWPIQLSGLATLYVGFTSKSNLRTDLTDKEKSDANTIASVTSAIGAGWILGTALLGAQRPYRSGLNSVSRYPGKDERSTLLRERLAEEALEKPARTMRILGNLLRHLKRGRQHRLGLARQRIGKNHGGRWTSPLIPTLRLRRSFDQRLRKASRI